MESRAIVVFRYDDYHASLGPETEAKDAIERRFLDAFAEHGVPLTLGVVPDYERRRSLAADAAKLDALRRFVGEGRGEAALHGLTHESLTPQGVRDSEFAGQPQEQQAERLRTGKAMVEDWLGKPVASFIPPWNTYDAATVAALAAEGFTALSAALSEPAVPGPLVSLPHTCGLREMRRVLVRLTRRGGLSVLVCMFHHFSFSDSPDPLARHYAQMSLGELGALLSWCRQRPGVALSTLSQAAIDAREALADGRVDEARARWQLVFGWRRVAIVGRAVRWLWAPHAILPPGAWACGDRVLRILSRLGRRARSS